jgi:hypothetical protein
VEKIMNKINVKKATGADGIPAKIVKASKSVIASQLSTLINITVVKKHHRLIIYLINKVSVEARSTDG